MDYFTKFYGLICAVLACLFHKVCVVKGASEFRCSTSYRYFTKKQWYDMFGRFNSSTIHAFLESSNETYFKGFECTPGAQNFMAPNSTLLLIGVCAQTSVNPADCVATAFYDGVECISAAWCSLGYIPDTFIPTGVIPGTFTADCSGIDFEFPDCALACEGNSTLVQSCTIDTMVSISTPTSVPTTSEPIWPPSMTPSSKTSTRGRLPTSAPTVNEQPTLPPSITPTSRTSTTGSSLVIAAVTTAAVIFWVMWLQ